jgi:restriction endonuclease Mrr
MGKITTQPLATETIRQAIDELKDDLYLELLQYLRQK